MTSILLIDDEKQWLELICRALPDYDVDQAESYPDALALLGRSTYDVAIVDLNLVETRSDGLGGKLLEIMRDRYPSIRRIALTGMSPTSTRAVFDQFDVDDLLLKESMNLAVVREVVDAALKRTANDVPRDLRAEKSELFTSMRTWNSDLLERLNQRAHTDAMRQDLGAKYTELMKLASGIRTRQDLVDAAQVFEQLKGEFDS